jgi:hypothetical protein
MAVFDCPTISINSNQFLLPFPLKVRFTRFNVRTLKKRVYFTIRSTFVYSYDNHRFYVSFSVAYFDRHFLTLPTDISRSALGVAAKPLHLSHTDHPGAVL